MTEYTYYKWRNDGGATQNIKSYRKNKLPVLDAGTTVANAIADTSAMCADTSADADTIVVESRHSDKKSICNERISSRTMVIQTAINPFLKNSDYLYDLNIQDTLLRSRDSNVISDENTLQL